MGKKILQINTVAGYGSTGRIVNDLGDLLIEEGFESYIAYGRKSGNSSSNLIRIGDQLDVYSHVLSTRIFDNHCFVSTNATKTLIKKIDGIQPDLIQLHNLHGYYLNIDVLFNYLQTINTPIVWSIHDAWPLTGHCTQFEHIGCEKWKEVCHKCPQKKAYPSSLIFDNSRKNFLRKKKLFNSLSNLNLITSSNWSADLISKSLFDPQEVAIIPNGVEQNIFKPKNENDFLKRHNIKDSFIVLGVSNVWNNQKGFADFIKLASLLDKGITLVMVGLTEQQVKNLPQNIIGIQRTSNTDELADLYSVSDVYVNLTYADTFPTTNLEALSCGTPVITYKTGGSVESVTPNTGLVVEQGDLNGVVEAISQIKKKGKDIYSKFCLELAQKNYNKKEQYRKYLALYKPLL